MFQASTQMKISSGSFLYFYSYFHPKLRLTTTTFGSRLAFGFGQFSAKKKYFSRHPIRPSRWSQSLRIWLSKDPAWFFPKRNTKKTFLGRQRKSPPHTQQLFLVGFPWKKNKKSIHPYLSNPVRLSCTPSGMSTRSPPVSCISESRRKHGGGTSFDEVTRGDWPHQSQSHTHTHVRKAPKHLGQMSR